MVLASGTRTERASWKLQFPVALASRPGLLRGVRPPLSAAGVRPYSGPLCYRRSCRRETVGSWERSGRSGACGQGWVSARGHRAPSLCSPARCPRCPRPPGSGCRVSSGWERPPRLGRAGQAWNVVPVQDGSQTPGAAAPSQVGDCSAGQDPG